MGREANRFLPVAMLLYGMERGGVNWQLTVLNADTFLLHGMPVIHVGAKLTDLKRRSSQRH